MTHSASCNDDPHVLMVDDREENLIALEALLSDVDATLHQARSGNEALASMLKHRYALVLLDVQMPGMDGYEVADLMQLNPTTRGTPIIFVTAINKDEPHQCKGYKSGAVDFLFKPINPFILQCKVRVFLDLWRQREEIELAMRQLEAANRKILEQQEELHKLAIHDHLTGLYQRRWFDEMIDKTLATAQRTGEPVAIALLDLDHFKTINDTAGHEAGDDVLVSVAQSLEHSIRAMDTVFRYGGEEFALIMPQARLALAQNVCERVRQAVACSSVPTSKGTLRLTVSIGVVCSNEFEEPTPREMMRTADMRLYEAKSAGRNRVVPVVPVVPFDVDTTTGTSA
ncbi:GGDEF domain-containing response regulator [Candidatus Symbiobacter mobilis]|uniref:diguanylate cyclase n=1 Tax=Candidatus Symbiobacter mobilis CR TaxID=946483 RepID=U5NB23_9BURK|nr:diguanylate cyclase [Candidatus Symbiobacter mobilis]AGX87359.1 response regulator [Candidatus Symbiobacter mobilis CR]